MNNIEQCASCGRMALTDKMITVSAAEYQSLQARANSGARPKSVSGYRALSRTGIARNPELADFILELIPTLTVSQVHQRCVEKLGASAPSRSQVYRFIGDLGVLRRK